MKSMPFNFTSTTMQGDETIDWDVFIYEGYHWVTDVKFGRQILLKGVYPIIIKRCSALPSNFHVTDEMVQKVMPIEVLHSLMK